MIAPETVRPAWRTAERKPQIGPDGNYVVATLPRPPEALPDGRYRPADLTDFFGRRLVRLNGLATLAPPEMVVLNTKPGKPDYFAALQRSEKLRMLQASLTAAQWRLIGSKEGLGVGDLTSEQKSLFLSFLPDPMNVNKVRVAGGGGWTSNRDSKPMILSGDQRSSVRLHISRIAQFSLPLEGVQYRHTVSSDMEGTEFGILSSRGDDNDSDQGKLFGQQIRNEVPSRLKPQQINFDSPALQVGIAIAGMKTVGEAVERIRATTRVEVYADSRAAVLPLWVRATDSQSVRAGELLKSLCWGLTGAVRRVSDGEDGVFVLTQDIEGLGVRLTRINDWAQAVQSRSGEMQSVLQEQIRKQEPLQYIQFDADDPSALNDQAAKKVEAGWKNNRGRWEGVSIPRADLTPQQQEIIRRGIEAYSTNLKSQMWANGESRNILDTGMISVSVQVRPTLIVPGVGEVRDQSLAPGSGMLSEMLPPADPYDDPSPGAPARPADTISLPPTMLMGGVFCVSPRTPTEAQKAVQAARARGLKQIWLILPLIPSQADNKALAAAKELVAAAVAEAETEKSAPKIIAGVRLLSLPLAMDKTTPVADAAEDTVAATTTEITRDITITGETPAERGRRRIADYLAIEADPVMPQYYLQNAQDWVSLEVPGLKSRILRCLTEVAATPGLSGIVLMDAAPPGYGLPSKGVGYYDNPGYLGYSNAHRVAFIRASGTDPIDMGGGISYGNLNLNLSFFGNQRIMYYDSATGVPQPKMA
ncbi:MAG: hypothetical protein H7Z41_06425, partial [Cytophagales bacterium]|nr:hypothetical protein [Armatimonadota bacterium]